MEIGSFELGLEQLDSIVSKIIDQRRQFKIFIFIGEMGSGKTTLIKRLCNQLEVIDEVQSPTFSLVNEYLTKNQETIYHFDLYRLKDENEVLDLGFDDYIYSGNLCFIEWPELIIDYLPENYVIVKIESSNDCRKYIIEQNE